MGNRRKDLERFDDGRSQVRARRHWRSIKRFSVSSNAYLILSGPLFTLSSTAPKVESAREQINLETNHNYSE